MYAVLGWNLKSLLTDWSGKIKEISRYALGWIVKSTSKLGEGDGCRQPLLGQCSLPRLWEKFKKRNSWKSNLYIKNESTQRLFITHIIWEISWKVYVLVELLKHIKTTCQMWGTIELLRDPIFKSALGVLKKVVRTLSYVYVWYTMWFHAKRSSETLKKTKSLIFLCNLGSGAQKSHKRGVDKFKGQLQPSEVYPCFKFDQK